MRIVAGRYRGARIQAPPGDRVRPTSDRAREALFNLLENGRHKRALHGQCVFDGCAGTGALGLEALSRGAEHVIFMEQAADALACLRANCQRLGAAENVTVIMGDVTKPGRRPPRQANLLLLDPPYNQGLGPVALTALLDAGWLATDCMVVLEIAAKEVFDPVAGFTLLDERRYGAARLVFLGRT